jgi:NitT/TauT family transport system substrate-binding protein
MSKSNYYLFALLILLAMLFQACTPAAQSSEELPDLGTLQVGYLASAGYAPFFVAKEKGYFEELGLDVMLQRFDSGSKMIAPLSAGQLDVGGGEPGTAMFNGIHQGLDIRPVCGFASQAQGFSGVPFLVRKDLFDSGAVTKPADLKGRKIGVNVQRGMSEYTVDKVMRLGGLTIDDAVMVEVPFPDMPAALANQAVDAVTTTYPGAAKVVNDGIAVVLLEGDQIAGEIQNGVAYFGKRLLDPANKEVGVRFLMAYLKANRELQGAGWKDPENLAIIEKYTGLPAAVIETSKRSYYNPDCDFVKDSLEDVQAYYISRGYTEYQQPMPISEVIDESFKNEAIKRIGRFED